MSKKIRQKVNKKKVTLDVLTYAALIIIVFLVNLPFISMLGTAFKGKSEALSSTALFPSELKFDSFIRVLTKTSFPVNSFDYHCIFGKPSIHFNVRYSF